jgi:hypothetical protein
LILSGGMRSSGECKDSPAAGRSANVLAGRGLERPTARHFGPSRSSFVDARSPAFDFKSGALKCKGLPGRRPVLCVLARLRRAEIRAPADPVAVQRCHSATSSHCHVVTLSQCGYVALWRCHGDTMRHGGYVALKLRRTVAQWRCRTETPPQRGSATTGGRTP